MIPTRTTLGSGNPASDICPSALHHRETHTLSRSQRDHSVTHRKDYKPFQILKNVKDQLFYLIEFGSQLFNTSIILYYLLFVKDYLYKLIFLRKMDKLHDLLRDKNVHISQHLVYGLMHNLMQKLMQLSIIYSLSQFTHPLCSYGHTSLVQLSFAQLDKKNNNIKYFMQIFV